MARRPQPAAVKAIKGNPGRRKIATAEARPEPAEANRTLPGWFDTRQAIPRGKKGWSNAERLSALTESVWNFIEPELRALNLVRKLDVIVLGQFCRYVAEWIDATVTIDREGATYETSSPHVEKMFRPHPALRQRKEAFQAIKDMSDKLGLTPAARQSLFQKMAVQLPEKAAKNDNAPAGELPLGNVGPVIGALASQSVN